MRPLIILVLVLIPVPILLSLTTAYHIDPSSLHSPGTPMTQYTPSGSLLHPSPLYRPWLLNRHSNNHSNNHTTPRPSWYRPHPHASYHNTTYWLNQDATPQQFSPEVSKGGISDFDDPKYIFNFLSDFEKEQEKVWWRTQTEEIDSLPRGAKICLVTACILFVYLIMDALGGNLAEFWLDSAEAREERKKERGRRIAPSWYKRYSFINAIKHWHEMTQVQMGINPGGPNSLNPARAPLRPPAEMTRFATESRTETRTETIRTERHVPYSAEAMRQMQEEINQLPVHEAAAPLRRPFGGMPGSPLWLANQARRAFRTRG